MPWIYRQSTGELSHHGKVVDKHGYSGHGAGKNKPSMQTVSAVGPIPQGTYRIGSPHHSKHVGNYAMALTPTAGTNTFGRYAFFMHGDSKKHPGEASEGCIIVSSYARHLVWASLDHEIRVVP